MVLAPLWREGRLPARGRIRLSTPICWAESTERAAMESGIAIIRQKLSSLPYVSRTWFEWTFEGGAQLKTLVVEVTFDTDPTSPDFHGMGEIERIAKDTLTGETTMIVSHLRVVPITAR